MNFLCYLIFDYFSILFLGWSLFFVFIVYWQQFIHLINGAYRFFILDCVCMIQDQWVMILLDILFICTDVPDYFVIICPVQNLVIFWNIVSIKTQVCEFMWIFSVHCFLYASMPSCCHKFLWRLFFVSSCRHLWHNLHNSVSHCI